MRTKEQIDEIIRIMEETYPISECALHYEKDYELLFAVRLSAQCTDARVNMITPTLFERFPSLEAFAAADISEVEDIIRSCGFFRTKARDLVECAKMLIENYGGKVPDSMEELTRLPGVGRKTANLVLGDIYNVPGSTVVDTHCIRISNRLGLVDGLKDPVKIEMALRELLPPDKSSDFCHRIVLHGRALCSARKPDCDNCPLRPHCQTGSEISQLIKA